MTPFNHGRALSDEVVVPRRDVSVDSTHQPRCSAGLPGLGGKRPSEFAQGAICFVVVATHATRDKVFPAVRSPSRFWLDMVDCVGAFAAISASMVVATQHTTPRQRNTARHRDTNVAAQDDDTGPIPQTRDPKDRVVCFVGKNVCFSGHDEHYRSAIRNYSEGLIAGVEDQGSHVVPFGPTWCVGFRGSATVARFGHKKSIVFTDNAFRCRNRDGAKRRSDLSGVPSRILGGRLCGHPSNRKRFEL